MKSHWLLTGDGEGWRERLGEIRVPTLVLHGTEDPFFQIGHALALEREIPAHAWSAWTGWATSYRAQRGTWSCGRSSSTQRSKTAAAARNSSRVRFVDLRATRSSSIRRLETERTREDDDEVHDADLLGRLEDGRPDRARPD